MISAKLMKKFRDPIMLWGEAITIRNFFPLFPTNTQTLHNTSIDKANFSLF